MSDGDRQQLRDELAGLRRRVADLETRLAQSQGVEERLRRRELQFRGLAEAAHDFLFVVGRDGRVQYVNRAAAAALGRRPDEVLGQPHSVLFPPETSARQRRYLRSVFEGGQPSRRVAKLCFPQGERWVDTRLVPLEGEGGEVEAVAGLCRDITEHKRVEEALRDSEVRWRSLVENAPSIIAELGRDGTVLFVNHTTTDVPAESLVGKDAYQYVLPEYRHILRDALERVFESCQTAKFEMPFEASVGRLWEAARLAPVVRGGEVVSAIAVAENVTERKRAEEALRESEANYRAIFDAANDAIFVHDAHTGEILDVNATFTRMYGYTAGEARGMPAGALSTGEGPYTREAALERVRRAATEGPQLFEWHARRKTGETFWVEVSLKRATIGGQERILAVVRDVTARREAEERLRFLTLAMAQSSEGLAVSDMEGVLLFVNRAFATLHGYAADEVVGRHLSIFHTPEQMPAVEAAVRESHQTGEFSGEVWHARRDGSVFPAFMHNTLLRHDAGAPIGMVAAMRDITEQKEAEERLALSESQYRSTLDSLGDSVHVIDADYRLVLCNQAFVELCDRIGMVRPRPGQPLFELLPFLTEQNRQEYRRVFERGETLVTEEELEFRGKEFMDEIRKIPVVEEDTVVRVITVIRNVTEQRLMERELRRAEKLESIGLLAGGIAHDFNNLLTGISANLAAAARRAGDERSVATLLAQAQRSCREARHLTDRLLTFARGGAPIKRPTPIADLLRERADTAITRPEVHCQLHIPDSLWAIDGDAVQIGQVVLNLLTNAQEALPQGGLIELRAENVELGPGQVFDLPEGRYVRITVRDDGAGISPDDLGRIFDPYFTTREEGLGLGLAATYSIVKGHGGHIAVESKPGEGSAFAVYLPAAQALEPATPDEAAGPTAGHRRVLLMDDDSVIRRGARYLLQDHGYEVACAADGAEAIELYQRAAQEGKAFDAVVLDLVVAQGMGGLECIEKLARLDPIVRAVACSGYSDDPVMAEFRKHGFCAAVRKPYTDEELCAALEAAMRDEGERRG
ncbi:MAG: PAS domain S-box protein [Candidatus Brocadiia bacterium]